MAHSSAKPLRAMLPKWTRVEIVARKICRSRRRFHFFNIALNNFRGGQTTKMHTILRAMFHLRLALIRITVNSNSKPWVFFVQKTAFSVELFWDCILSEGILRKIR